ncbi:MAG TPA: anthranilate synthase component I family protein [Candidatus Dormibacteraeota bacterium]|nr:anthranilate synthase component I family protein [Candidatus Dormibacteraeota bacterium]
MPTQEVAPAARHAALVRRGRDRPHRVLLDGDGDAWGDGTVRYSDTPAATLTCYASGWSAWREAGATRWRWGDPFAAWQAFVDAQRPALGDGGGIATALAYDLKHAGERLARRLPWPTTPLLFAAAYDWSYRADVRRGRAWIAARDAERLARGLAWFAAPDAPLTPPRRPLYPRPLLDRETYGALVARVQAYIAAGDVYQVNLAQPFHAAAARTDAAALLAAWTERYPMPYAAYLDGGDWTLVSNSPECLLRVDGEHIATLPIKGTRRAGGGVAGGLAADAKERAEHVMIVDLERNDLGRVCVAGSVAVSDLFAEHAFPLLVHMVSEVHGRLRPHTSLAAVLRALFPGGSITGAPKIRAMEIIEELEPAPRGFYTGAVGWTEPDGRSVFNIAIRTAVLDAAGLCYWAGGGIVADSQAAREYAETLLKTEALVHALRGLERTGA